MYSGVARDTKIKVQPDMKLDVVSHNVFFPAQDYFNCNLLPIEWLELLDDVGFAQRRDIFRRMNSIIF